jgi:hypothetical protein
MKREIIDVTADDIAFARRLREQRQDASGRNSGLSPNNCPVAVALIRCHPGHALAGVMPDAIHQDGRWALPSRRMVRFMSRWDRQWRASPARFLVVWKD